MYDPQRECPVSRPEVKVRVVGGWFQGMTGKVAEHIRVKCDDGETRDVYAENVSLLPEPTSSNLASMDREAILALYLSEKEWREAFQSDALKLITENDALRGSAADPKPSEIEARELEIDGSPTIEEVCDLGRCQADMTDRDNEHWQYSCTLREEHLDAHYDASTGAEWTDGTTTLEERVDVPALIRKLKKLREIERVAFQVFHASITPSKGTDPSWREPLRVALTASELEEDPEVLCETCGDPYLYQRTPSLGFYCSNAFHCCRECVWVNGQVTKPCMQCSASAAPPPHQSQTYDDGGVEDAQRASEEQYDADKCTCVDISIGNSLTTHMSRWTADCMIHGFLVRVAPTFDPEPNPEPPIDAFGQPWPVFFVGDGVCLKSCPPITGLIRAVYPSGCVDVEWKGGEVIKNRSTVGMALSCKECRGRLYVVGVLDDLERCEKCNSSGPDASEPIEDVCEREELALHRVRWSRVSGALCDAGTVNTDDFEKGIRELTAERDLYRDALKERAESRTV